MGSHRKADGAGKISGKLPPLTDREIREIDNAQSDTERIIPLSPAADWPMVDPQ